MIKKLLNRTKYVILLLTASSIVWSFCIFTNSQGYYRKYLDSDIPFFYTLNSSTPPAWIPAIDAGAQTWEDLPSGYWEFENGGFTNVTSDEQDGINLVFFDLQGINFPPPTNTIAYSRTWTQGSGASYHAVESDLVWNARDFPPSPNGASNQQDIQSVITHEFGHHLGLAHTGPEGGPPGCGELIPTATMYGFSSNGDTTNRSLHIDDIASISMTYPSWILQGSVTDASTGLSIGGAGLVSNEVFAAVITGPIVSPSQGRYEIPGAAGNIPVNFDGSYYAAILRQQVNLEIQYFGYQTQTAQISFNPPGGIGQTQTIIQDFALQQSPAAVLSGTLEDSLTAAVINGEVEIFAAGNKPGRPSGALGTVTSANGAFGFNVPSGESYKIVVTPQIPYPVKSFMFDNLPAAGMQATLRFKPADVLLVNDDLTANHETFLQQSLNNTGVDYYTWRIAESGVPQAADYSFFPEPRTVVWYTGDADTDVLSDAEQQSLATFLDGGGRLLLSGQNIAETSSSGILLSSYLEVGSAQNYNLQLLKGVENDPIGAGLLVAASGGGGNQNSKDVLTIGSSPIVSFNYGPAGTSGIAGIRAEDFQANWKAVFLGFGLEGVNNNNGIRDLIIGNALVWFDVITGLDSEGEIVSATPPESFELYQNFPNPFNPTTTIRFSVPRAARVKIAIFNNLGQEIRRLSDNAYPAGVYELTWDGRDDFGNPAASGIYFYTMRVADKFSDVKKMVFLK
jgi:hypothetical protein